MKTTSPARIDLAGGWTDTPPVSYEYGGTVVNAAIKVDGSHPLEARVRRISTEPVIRFWMEGQDEPVVCREKEDISDYGHPLAPAALSKTGVLCIGLVDLADKRSLAEQLAANLGADGDGAIGLEVITASRLPMGSGLGGSSILGGALLQAMGVAVGRAMDTSSLVHAVLKLEQMLSSGGGWQDQVGGLYGGFKICRSPAQLPLKVESEVLSASPETVAKFNSHLVLCYSGRARLARNLLQGVLRRWAARLPEVVDTVSNLVPSSPLIPPTRPVLSLLPVTLDCGAGLECGGDPARGAQRRCRNLRAVRLRVLVAEEADGWRRRRADAHHQGPRRHVPAPRGPQTAPQAGGF